MTQSTINRTDRTSQIERLARYFVGYTATHLIRFGVESGLFEGLAAKAEWISPQDLALELGLEALYVEHFLRAAFALELLDYDASSERFRLAPFMDALIAQPENYGYLGHLPRLNMILARDFERMRDLIKTGGTYTYQEHDEKFIDAVAHSTAGIAGFIASKIVPTLPGLGERDDLAFLDIGSGAGGTVIALAQAFPHSHVVGVDVEPQSIEKANTRIRAAGLADRVEARLSAAEDLSETGSFDLVTLVQVLHETKQEVRKSILSRAHAALRPGGLLLIIDEPYPHDLNALREAPGAAVLQFIEIFWGNIFLSPEDQQRMVESADFSVLSQTIPPPGFICIRSARRS